MTKDGLSDYEAQQLQQLQFSCSYLKGWFLFSVMMEESANLDATLYKLFLKLDGHSAVFQIKQLYKTRRLCHSEPEKSEEHLMKVEKER